MTQWRHGGHHRYVGMIAANDRRAEITGPGLAEGRSRRGAGERHARLQTTHLSTNTSDADFHNLAIMGALLSVPFLAMPAMGTVCTSPLRDCAR